VVIPPGASRTSTWLGRPKEPSSSPKSRASRTRTKKSSSGSVWAKCCSTTTAFEGSVTNASWPFSCQNEHRTTALGLTCAMSSAWFCWAGIRSSALPRSLAMLADQPLNLTTEATDYVITGNLRHAVARLTSPQLRRFIQGRPARSAAMYFTYTSSTSGAPYVYFSCTRAHGLDIGAWLWRGQAGISCMPSWYQLVPVRKCRRLPRPITWMPAGSGSPPGSTTRYWPAGWARSAPSSVRASRS